MQLQKSASGGPSRRRQWFIHIGGLIVDAVDRRILQKLSVWDRVASIVTDPDLLVLTLICIIGLLLSLVVTLAVPGFAEATEALQQFLSGGGR